MNDPSLERALASAAANGEFLAELRQVLAEAEDDARRQGLECRSCGECCLFEQFGHRLYVSTGELALLLGTGAGADKLEPGRCPHYRDRLCTAREDRSLGCRLFHCGPEGTQWFQDAYEQYHQRIRRLHERHGVPYLYVSFSR